MNENLKNAALEVLDKIDRGEEIGDYELAILKTAILARNKECEEKKNLNLAFSSFHSQIMTTAATMYPPTSRFKQAVI